jgi:hypothetical protein
MRSVEGTAEAPQASGLNGHNGPGSGQWIAMFATMAVSLASPFVTTLLGLVAIGQIRQSQGRLYGMPLAIADAMIFPLIALDLLIGVFWYNVLPRDSDAHWSRVVALTILASVIVDILLARWCWRAATRE